MLRVWTRLLPDGMICVDVDPSFCWVGDEGAEVTVRASPIQTTSGVEGPGIMTNVTIETT
jgi:hypothetical protein